MRNNHRYLYSFLFGGLTFVLFALLAFTTVRNAVRDKALIMQNARDQGYWIIRSLEIGHSMLLENHTEAMRSLVKEIQKHAVVRALVIVDENQQVLLASDATLEGTRWREQVWALNRAKAPHEPEILVNVGMNTGQVLLGATMIKGAMGEHFTYTGSGMVTNIASRLCDLGNKGEIHLSAATAQLVIDYFKLHGPHEVPLKHIRGPLPVYKLA